MRAAITTTERRGRARVSCRVLNLITDVDGHHARHGFTRLRRTTRGNSRSHQVHLGILIAFGVGGGHRRRYPAPLLLDVGTVLGTCGTQKYPANSLIHVDWCRWHSNLTFKGAGPSSSSPPPSLSSSPASPEPAASCVPSTACVAEPTSASAENMSGEGLLMSTPAAPAPAFPPSVATQPFENEDCAAGRCRRAIATVETCRCLLVQVDVLPVLLLPLITNPAVAAAVGGDRLLRLPTSRARERAPPRPRGTNEAVAAAAAVTDADIPAAAVDEAAMATPASQMLRIAVAQ